MLGVEPQKCMVRLHREWRGPIEATLLGFVPSAEVYGEPIAAGDARLKRYTVDALVRLETFSKGSVYQIPVPLVRIVEKWDRELEET